MYLVFVDIDFKVKFLQELRLHYLISFASFTLSYYEGIVGVANIIRNFTVYNLSFSSNISKSLVEYLF